MWRRLEEPQCRKAPVADLLDGLRIQRQLGSHRWDTEWGCLLSATLRLAAMVALIVAKVLAATPAVAAGAAIAVAAPWGVR